MKNTSLGDKMCRQLHEYAHKRINKNYNNVHINTSITMLGVDVSEAIEHDILIIINIYLRSYANS